MKILLICGGPSLERGISLNSARSILDHLGDEGIEIVPLYFDHKKRPYRLQVKQLYSNTPSDFDFKLQQTGKFLSSRALKDLFKEVDLAFPVMHGQFGEDGGVQRLLERYRVPYVGSGVEACRRCSDKFEANEFIRSQGFFALPSAVLKIFRNDHEKIINNFFKKHNLKRAIIKPATGGSSIGVFSVGTASEALEKAKLLFSKRMDTRLVLEPFCEGIEFTVILLQNKFGMPVAVLPTEIEADYTEHQIFDFRKKYLPTRQVRYHCPPRFDNNTIERIQVQAEQLFSVLGMRDFARFDGWLLPDGKIWFSDFNPISGMEQNSFLFQQASRIGMSHRNLLRFIVKNACRRYSLFPQEFFSDLNKKRKPINVLFGGNTAERQVSLMSGTNAWLKLRQSKKYEPRPFLLDLHGAVWSLPYALTLNHTVEEIYENCRGAKKNEKKLSDLVSKVRWRLFLTEDEASESFFLPQKMTLEFFIRQSEFVFIGLHGGIGEDGTLQRLLGRQKIIFNGSEEKASALCMDKYKTIQALKNLDAKWIQIIPQKVVLLRLLRDFKRNDFEYFWEKLCLELQSKTIIVKPRADGCSSGVVRLSSSKDLEKYISLAGSGVQFIKMGTFKNQSGIIEMPLNPMKGLLFEQFIETDKFRIRGNKLKWTPKNGWIEVTVGVLEINGILKALSPSLTVAEGQVLSVEEKFQGGTGVNITPPFEFIIKPGILEKTKGLIEKVASRVGIKGYARIDAFMEIETGKIKVIEVNTTPALTPSTVLFHQALAEKTPIYPRAFLEKIIENKGY
ncbi:MAG: D-alanine-D-alanine ligase [Candidatus Peregrinibacteria bacterium GW2011_GWF2_39_17]|nr:MAG: D-alanine-D-alanine ligase [Candidatus Peregrinibacteria bacterium GW2011_GWF2_39_17]HCW32903.1 hypothetical protein [Candidatus Peregrinibacteria bacterium]